MPITLRRGLRIPLWAGAFCAVAGSEPYRLMPFLMTLVGIAAVGSTMPAIIRRFPLSRRHVEVFPSLDETPPPPPVLIMTGDVYIRTVDEVKCAGTVKADDAADLMRMDDDGGWHLAQQAAA